ncbi:MAG: OPT family oligopeptide transporter, partial [Propionibacteriaceae bacterium]
IVISFFVLLPIRTAGHLADKGTMMKSIKFIFKQDVRFIGAGTIAIAAVWTFFKVIGPIVKGIKESLADSKKGAAGVEIPRTERDLSMKTVLMVTLGSMLPVGALLFIFLRTGGAKVLHNPLLLVIVAVLFILVIGLAVASVCGYMAGLIGASNSPISGVGILGVITAALVIYAVNGKPADDSQMTALVAYTLFTAAVVFGVATISNDNLQDLKTGQLVEATPWKQQVALVIGVIFGSLVIPPVLNLLNGAFGFDGAPGAGENALAAPQASLISSLAKGVFGGSIDWGLLGLGAIIGAVVIAIDEVLVRTNKKRAVKLALPPLAVGMGMYLPCDMTFMITVGAIIGLCYDKWANKQVDPERSKRLGTLLATGLIVGESLFGVLYAGIVAGSGLEEPLAIKALAGDYFDGPGAWVGLILFAAIVAG